MLRCNAMSYRELNRQVRQVRKLLPITRVAPLLRSLVLEPYTYGRARAGRSRQPVIITKLD